MASAVELKLIVEAARAATLAVHAAAGLARGHPQPLRLLRAAEGLCRSAVAVIQVPTRGQSAQPTQPVAEVPVVGVRRRRRRGRGKCLKTGEVMPELVEQEDIVQGREDEGVDDMPMEPVRASCVEVTRPDAVEVPEQASQDDPLCEAASAGEALAPKEASSFDDGLEEQWQQCIEALQGLGALESIVSQAFLACERIGRPAALLMLVRRLEAFTKSRVELQGQSRSQSCS